MGGVVWNLVIFHLSSLVDNDEKRAAKSALPSEVLFPGVIISSEMADMLLRLTVSARDMSETAKVALSKGSSQQGNARRAEVGYVLTVSTRVKLLDYQDIVTSNWVRA